MMLLESLNSFLYVDTRPLKADMHVFIDRVAADRLSCQMERSDINEVLDKHQVSDFLRRQNYARQVCKLLQANNPARAHKFVDAFADHMMRVSAARLVARVVLVAVIAVALALLAAFVLFVVWVAK